jgi:hypothetical protein
MKRVLLTSLLLLAACDRGAEAPRQPPQRENAGQPPMPELEPPTATAEEDREDAADAAAVLRRYYGRIEAGEYDAAWGMRTGDADDEQARQRFADNFKAYQRYHADVGQPGPPVEAQGWAYVEVPVMIVGAFRGGGPFASSGSVTLRRATTADARADQRGWRVYTGVRRGR